MTADEFIVSCAVKVNGGSGVLVSALSTDFSYVLTAAHVVNGPLNIVRGDNLLTVIGEPYRHAKYDCCLIKVDYQPDVVQRLWRGELAPASRISFVGYPRTNIGTERPYKIYAGTTNDQAHQCVVCNLDNGPRQEAIEGMSGGGVYSVVSGAPHLWGVEARMDDEDEDDRYGRIRCYPISCFDQIIDLHQLVQMAPSYMRCFSSFKGEIFKFNAVNMRNVEALKGKLDELAAWLIEQDMPGPYDLMLRYRRELLLDLNDPDSLVLNKELWVAYLEFVVICSVLDDVYAVDEEYLASLDRRRRFMYSGSGDNWIWKLSDLVRYAKEMLDANGVVFVSSPEENAFHVPDDEDLLEVIDDIASSPSFRSKGRIDSAHGDILKTYSFAHLKGLRNKFVLAKHRVYGGASPAEQLPTLKDYYGRAIKEKI